MCGVKRRQRNEFLEITGETTIQTREKDGGCGECSSASKIHFRLAD